MILSVMGSVICSKDQWYGPEGGTYEVKSTNERKKRARERTLLYSSMRSVRSFPLTKRGPWKILALRIVKKPSMSGWHMPGLDSEALASPSLSS